MATPQFATPRASFIMPLQCADDRCRVRYNEGAYTPGMVTSVLDHSLVLKTSNGFYQYGTADNDSDGRVVAFNGEIASGARARDRRCIRGTISLPLSARTALANTRGCGSGYASYDEHPGYDYVAAVGTPVRAAATGRVVTYQGGKCIPTNLPRGCTGTGYVGIDHGGWITQYGHMSSIVVESGQRVVQGQRIGLSGEKGVEGAPHLHFEVVYNEGGIYYIVDPYGWTGRTRDPLYSARTIPARRLWQ